MVTKKYEKMLVRNVRSSCSAEILSMLFRARNAPAPAPPSDQDKRAADNAYQALVSQIGSAVNDAQRQADSAQALTTAVDDRRQSTSGVSMDEEMTNLVRFQRAYQASARAMSSMDEMLDVLINRTGRVGL